VEDRHARDARSWKLGAVRMTERFLAGETVKRKQLKALRAHVRDKLADAGWLADAAADGASLAGIGGTVRNLASAAELAADLPSFGVQGFLLERKALDDLVEQFADLPSAKRGEVPGIKPERGDLILAGAVVLQTVMEVGGFETLEVTEAGLREGVFYSTLLAGEDPPLFADVRHRAVCNLAAQYHDDMTHPEHVARLSLQMWDELGEAGVHPCDPRERDLLWAAAILHDIGTAVDYDDHHKHSRYLILNASLPGHSTRETALIGQLARYHRKGTPSLGAFEKLARKGDDELLARGAALLRVAEQLERSRDQAVHDTTVVVDDGQVELRLEADEDVSVARWGAERQRELFQSAFGKDLIVSSG
jgi:exopolyphosphatase/guanosine-5'-triphosphate,3'-diphosphate pyrophosphatase